MKTALLILAFIVVGFWDDFGNLIVFTLGPVNIYPMDFLMLLAVVYFLKQRGRLVSLWANVRRFSLPFRIFLVWILLSILRGFIEFSYSAYGDGRIVLPFLFGLVSIDYFASLRSSSEFAKLFWGIMMSSALAVLLMFCIEMWIGHRFSIFLEQSADLGYGELEDARGIRVLNTVETFAGAALIAGVVASAANRIPISRFRKFLSFAMVPVCLVSQNRSALASIAFAIAVFGLMVGRRVLKPATLFKLALAMLVGIALVALVFPGVMSSLAALIEAGIDPAADPTGTWPWRLALAQQGILQFLESPIFGQGFGAHWFFDMGGIEIAVPPHDQYVTLLVKMGALGFVLLLLTLTSFFVRYSRTRESVNGELRAVADAVFIIVLANIPYGFAYDYFPLFSFYLGVFYSIGTLVNHPGLVSSGK